jgi:hypothetical protein
MNAWGGTDGGASIELRTRGVMDKYMIGPGGQKSYSGSATGATEGAAYIQLTSRGPMDKYLIGPGSCGSDSHTMKEYLNRAGAEFETFNLHKLRVYNNA